MNTHRIVLATAICAAAIGASAATEINTNQLNALTYNALTYNALTYNGIAINASSFHAFTGTDAAPSVGAIDDKRLELQPYTHPDTPLLVAPLTVIKKEGARTETLEMPEPNGGVPMQPQLVQVQLGAMALD